MQTNELLFAHHIRALAVESRNLARSKYFEFVLENFREDIWMNKMRDWDKANPVQLFIAAAFTESENVNRLLYSISTGSSPE